MPRLVLLSNPCLRSIPRGALRCQSELPVIFQVICSFTLRLLLSWWVEDGCPGDGLTKREVRRAVLRKWGCMRTRALRAAESLASHDQKDPLTNEEGPPAPFPSPTHTCTQTCAHTHRSSRFWAPIESRSFYSLSTHLGSALVQVIWRGFPS